MPGPVPPGGEAGVSDGPGSTDPGSAESAEGEAGVYPRLTVVALVLDPEADRWLLVRTARFAGQWAPVGGRVQAGEGLAEAIAREVLEEVGLPVSVAGPCYAALVSHRGEETCAVSMACRPLAPPSTCRSGEEVLEIRWVTEAEWRRLADEGRSPWRPDDVARGPRLARLALQIDLEEEA